MAGLGLSGSGHAVAETPTVAARALFYTVRSLSFLLRRSFKFFFV